MKLFSNIKLLFWGAITSLFLSSCLDSKESESIVTNYFNAIITKFSLSENANVASGLSKYAFTIDNYGYSDATIHERYPNDGIIFNADSLPYGTIPDSLRAVLSFSKPDSAFFHLYSLDGKLQQYSNVGSDSALYFASYPDIRLTLSARGVRKTYHIKINVHKVASDTIKWHTLSDNLWTDITVKDQRTDTIGDIAYWFVESGSQNQVITADIMHDPYHWTEPATVMVEGGELLDLQTLYSWHKAFYAATKESRTLVTSTDGYNWQTANKEFQFTAILGNQFATQDVYGNWNKDSLNAIVHYEDAYHFAVSADAKEWRIDKIIPRNFPIRGFSRPISVAARPKNGNLSSRLYLVGGMTADGRSLSASTWSCDGYNEIEKCRNWAEFPHSNIPAMQNASLVEYAVNQKYPKSFWILQPGFITDGSIPQSTHYSKPYATLYYSEDNGVSWHDLFSKYPKMTDNSAFSDLVPCSVICNEDNFMIYYFGGKKTDGSFSTQLWGGQLPLLSFVKKL